MTEEWDDERIRCVRSWLASVRGAVSRARSLEEQMLAETDELDSVRAIVYDGMPHASAGSPDDALVAHIEKRCEIIAELTVAMDIQRSVVLEANDVFVQLKCHPDAMAVLAGRWIRRQTWAQICRETYYSESYLRGIERQAMLECYDLMPHRFRIQVPRSD